MNKLVIATFIAGLTLVGSAKENILICQAHPDDLEGCIGFAIKAKDKFNLHVLSYTGGEGGIPGKSGAETRAIRRAEDLAVAKELNATMHWLGQIDGSASATLEAVDTLKKLIAELKPRAIFVHSPFELHPDHTMCFAAVWKAWVTMPRPRCEIYFFEEGGIGQTHNFHPTHYLDITDIWSEKVRLIRLWASQNKDDELIKFKEPESLLRGQQMVQPVKYGEAYESVIGVPEKGLNVFQELEAGK